MKSQNWWYPRALVCVCLFLVAALSGFSQSPPPEPKSTPAMKETGEPEGDAFHFPHVAVDPGIYQLNDPFLTNLARRMEDGSATLIERRAYYWLLPRLYPFDKPVSPDWRLKVREAIKASEAERARKAKSTNSPTTVLTWANLGPPGYNDGYGDIVSGRATAIWADPANKSHILLGTADGGVWETTNQGGTWTPIFDAEPTLSIGSIGVSPTNPNVIYVGTGEDNFSGDVIGGEGLFKSTTGGSSWSLLNTPAWTTLQPHHSISRIVVDPRNESNVYAATDDGLWYSGDGGTTWNRSTIGLATAPRYLTDLYVDPTSSPIGTPSILYVALGYPWGDANNGIYRSTLGPSGPWTKITDSPGGSGFPTTNLGRIALVTTSAPKRLYALAHNASTDASLGIFSTLDATANPVAWTAGSAQNFCSTQCWYDIAGVTDPADPSHLVVGGLDNYASNDGGATLNQISYWTAWGTGFSHADHHFLVMPDSSTIYDANDGGFFIGTVDWTGQPSATWVNKNTGLGTLQFYGFAQDPKSSTRYQGGLQDNGQAYFDGTTWDEVYGGDGGCSAWDSGDNSIAYEEYVYGYIQRNSTMLASPTSWTCMRNFGGCSCASTNCIPDGSTDFIAPFTLDANDPNSMYLGTTRLYWNPFSRSGDGWTAISGNLTSGGSNYITAVHSAKNSGMSGILYVGTREGYLWITTDQGASWHNRSAGMSGGPISSIVTDPANPLHVIAAISGHGTWHMNVSTNGGLSWTFMTTGLPAEPFNTVILDPSDPNHAYAGSDYGVYENTAVWTSNAWSSITYNLPAVSVQQLAFSPGTMKLRAATHGRGIWEASLISPTGLPTPKEVSPFKDMQAVKGAGTSVSVTYAAACNAADNTVYAGALGTLQAGGINWTGRFCNEGNTGALSFDPGAGSFYFVVVGNNAAGIEGSYGQGSAGERPPAGSGAPCSYTQDLSGSCP